MTRPVAIGIVVSIVLLAQPFVDHKAYPYPAQGPWNVTAMEECVALGYPMSWIVLESSTRHVYLLGAIVNVLIGGVATALFWGSGVVRRRKELRASTWSLCELVVGITLLSVFLAVVVNAHSETAAAKEFAFVHRDSVEVLWSPSLPIWLDYCIRRVGGKAAPERPYGLAIARASVLDDLLSNEAIAPAEIRYIRVYDNVGTQTLAKLAHFTHLETLDVSYTDDEINAMDDGICFGDFPALRSLGVAGKRGVLSGLNNLPNLELLVASGTVLDMQSLKSIGTLTKLRTLEIQEAQIPAGGLLELRGVTNLEVLYANGVGFGDSELSWFMLQNRLNRVYISSDSFTKSALNAILHLKSLKELRIAGCDIPAPVVERWKKLRPDCIFTIECAAYGGAG